MKKLFRGAIEVGRNFPIMLVPVDGKRVEVSAFKKASFKEQLPADADMMAKVRPDSFFVRAMRGMQQHPMMLPLGMLWIACYS